MITLAELEKLVETLEPIVDQFGIDEVLQALVHICDEKAEHVAVHWQDTITAKWWADAANAIGITHHIVTQGRK